MAQNTEANAFIRRLKDPGSSLDSVLQPCLDDEAQLRRLFATDKQNTRLNDNYVGLVDVFDAPTDIRTIRARVVKDEEDLSAKYVMPLSDKVRKKDGEQAMVNDLEEFRQSWTIFTEGSLSQLLDWNNVIAAGGSVLACLTPLPEYATVSKRVMRKHFHSKAYPSSDVDLFLYGLTPAGAEAKIIKIYEAVRDSVPWDVTCVRTKHTVSIHSQYPYRSIQIVLRLYTSPAEILAGFDIDSACFAYDGSRVWGNPRAIVAMIGQCNTVDMTRRSPSYEVRLAKYHSRGFEVHVPTLNRAEVDPTIYERAISRVEGLARLLVFEKIKDADSREKFLEARRALRGRPQPQSDRHMWRRRKRRRTYGGDLKADTAIGGLEMNDYDVQLLHIPYGPGWNAHRIEKLVFRTDLGMNSPFNPKNKTRRLHRHPAFFGTAEECLADCCEFCPDPIDEDERQLQKKEDEQYIRGRISFVEEDPGRQIITGSFHPIDVGEWAEQVYIGPTERFFSAIVAGDREAVLKMIEEGTDVTRRDHVGRMPLHVAIMARCEDIACELIDRGARITSRLADGRTALHLAAKMDMLGVVKKLLEKSRVNAEKLKSEKVEDVPMKDATTEHPSSEDDWSSDDNGVISMDEDMQVDNKEEDEDEDMGGQDGEVNEDGDVDEADEDEDNDTGSDGKEDDDADAGGFPEDTTDEPDVFEVNAPDWDLGLTPIDYAILFASPHVLEALLSTEGINISLPSQNKKDNSTTAHPLLITMYREDDVEASRMIEVLVAAGAKCSTADSEGITFLQRLINANKVQHVLTLLRVDPTAVAAINFPVFTHEPEALSPVTCAIQRNNYAMVAVLIAHGARLEFKEEDVANALEILSQNADSRTRWLSPPEKRLDLAVQPIEAALSIYSDLIHLLVPLGAPVEFVIRSALNRYPSDDDKMSLLEWLQFAIHCTKKEMDSLDERSEHWPRPEKPPKLPQNLSLWQAFALGHLGLLDEPTSSGGPSEDLMARYKANAEKWKRPWVQLKIYLEDAEKLVSSNTTKTYRDLYPKDEDPPELRDYSDTIERAGEIDEKEAKVIPDRVKYGFLSRLSRSHGNTVPQHQHAEYDELFKACLNGDNATIQRLCLPPEVPVDGHSPLQITVEVLNPVNDWRDSGLTPLSVAVMKRHWDTAQLIFTISGAQYKPDSTEYKFKPNLTGFHDSDFGSDNGSEDSDDTVDKAPIDFIDVAKRPSQVQARVPPSKMLHETAYHYKNEDGCSKESDNLILAALEQNDTQAFGRIFDLYKLSDPPVKISTHELSSMLSTILIYDRDEMLDRFIRKTGLGVTLKVIKQDGDGEEREVRVTNDKNKVYYGLNVHGKKRKDLARQSDPNAGDDDDDEKDTSPLVWNAALYSSHKILDYLVSDRPLEAYRYYAMCNSDERAIALRRIKDIKEAVPRWLGWSISTIGESPLSAAVLSQSLPTVKKMFALDPKLMSLALKENIKFTGYNLLMVAVQQCCSPKMIDYFLSNGLSAVQTDTPRGWNIFHLIGKHTGDAHLLEHLLKTLPRDVSEALLLQQSKRRLNTPIHLAIVNGYTEVVQLIVNFSPASLHSRNLQGSLPIHVAVGEACPEITKALVSASPIELLHSENGIGSTPIELITSKYLASNMIMKDAPFSGPDTLTGRHDIRCVTLWRSEVEHLEKEIPEFKRTIAMLKTDEKMEKAFSAFARHLETQLANARPAYEASQQEKAEKVKEEVERKEREMKRAREEGTYRPIPQKDTTSVERTYQVVRDAMAARPGQRQLVHIVDVQKSVEVDLQLIQTPTKSYDSDNEDGEALEGDEYQDSNTRNKAFIFRYSELGNVDPFYG